MPPDGTRSVLLVGNFLSKARPGTHSVGEFLAEQLTLLGWRVATTSSHPRRLLRAADMLRTIWRRRRDYAVAQVDVFSGSAFRWAEWTTTLLRRLRKPYIITLHGGNLPAFAALHPARTRSLLQFAHQVTTPSRLICSAVKTLRASITVLPNPLDLSNYFFRLRTNPSPTLVWLRAFHEIYNPCMAVRCLAEVLPFAPGATLTMYGPDLRDGSLNRARSLMRSLNVEGKVLIAGPLQKRDVGRALSEADIFLNTTRFESFGVGVVEAAASGLCIVTTAVGEIPLLWQDGIDALLVPDDDSITMATAVRRVLSDQHLSRQLSQCAHRGAHRFSAQSIIHQWNELLSLAAHS